MRIFNFTDYKKYLHARLLGVEFSQRRGSRSRMAEVAGCQTAYVSQVLGGKSDFSLDQAEALNDWLQHNDSEANYFLLLVQHARAATPKLRRRIKRQLDLVRGEESRLSKRLAESDTLTEEQKSLFCESWIYSAVLLACRIPNCNATERIAERLRLPNAQVRAALERLEREGFVEKDAGLFRPLTKKVFLSDRTAMIKAHHTNWRLKAVESLDRAVSEDLHYSAAITCARSDISELREIFAEAIERFRAKVSTSKDEELFAYSVDFFSI